MLECWRCSRFARSRNVNEIKTNPLESARECLHTLLSWLFNFNLSICDVLCSFMVAFSIYRQSSGGLASSGLGHGVWHPLTLFLGALCNKCLHLNYLSAIEPTISILQCNRSFIFTYFSFKRIRVWQITIN